MPRHITSFTVLALLFVCGSAHAAPRNREPHPAIRITASEIRDFIFRNTFSIPSFAHAGARIGK